MSIEIYKYQSDYQYSANWFIEYFIIDEQCASKNIVKSIIKSAPPCAPNTCVGLINIPSSTCAPDCVPDCAPEGAPVLILRHTLESTFDSPIIGSPFQYSFYYKDSGQFPDLGAPFYCQYWVDASMNVAPNDTNDTNDTNDLRCTNDGSDCIDNLSDYLDSGDSKDSKDSDDRKRFVNPYVTRSSWLEILLHTGLAREDILVLYNELSTQRPLHTIQTSQISISALFQENPEGDQ